MDISEYALSKVNTFVTVPTNPYGGQCVALIDNIVRHFTPYNMAYTNAIDTLNKAKQLGFKVTYDAIGLAPKKNNIYVIDTGDEYGHIGVCIQDSDGSVLEGVEQNVDGFVDNNKDGINDQLQVGGPTRRVTRYLYEDSTVETTNGTILGKLVGWFEIPSVKGENLDTKVVNGDVFSTLITDVDPNIMNADSNRTTIDRIVIHHNAGTSDENARRTWYVSTGVGTSAHYQVTPNKLWGCVGENSVAYHAGDYGMNQRSIGIEHLNNVGAPVWTIAEETYARSAKLIADICKRYGIPCDRSHIIKHSEVYATACPGGIDIDRLVRMAKDIMDNKNSKPDVKPTGKITIENVDFKKGTLRVKMYDIVSPSGIKEVKFPSWSEENGQDDLVWYTGDKASDTIYVKDIKMSDHKNNKGKFNIHGYITLPSGAQYAIGGTSIIMDDEPKGEISVSIDGSKVTVTVDKLSNKNGINGVLLPTWTEIDGQDDIKWYKATKLSDTKYQTTFDISEHNNEKDKYFTHAYIELKTGGLVFVNAVEYTIDSKQDDTVVVAVSDKSKVKIIELTDEELKKLKSK